MKTCKVEGCQRKYFGNGYCNMHYNRVRDGIQDMRPEPLTHKRGICSIAGCGRPHSAKGYCLKHFMNFKHNSEGGRPCKFPGCRRTYYAKGYCRKHHAIYLRKGVVEYKFPHVDHCLVEGCQNNGKLRRGLCVFHYGRFKNHKDLILPRNWGNSGSNNHRWNGGIAYYSNHYELKKNRLIKLKSVNYFCEFCGGKARHVHHLDGSKTNHAIENLVAVCAKCHISNFHKKPHISKYKRLYGLTSKELIKAGIYDQVKSIHKKLRQFKSTQLQAA